ncbi:MAG: CHAT domain-containing protein, partial [Anaerolineae bacterium]
MTENPDLEIGLARREGEIFTLELRLNDPRDRQIRAPFRATVSFDRDQLRAQEHDPEAYGQLLTDALFKNPNVRSEFSQARARTADRTLRLRLLIDRNASDLHRLRWETLRDPQDGAWLVVKEHLLFSRLLASTSWEQVELRARSELRALVAIANPANLGEYTPPGSPGPLAPIDVAGELERARQALAAIPVTPLTSDRDAQERVTTNRLIDGLRRGHDLLYLVCHGALLADADPPGPYLYLDKEDGTAEPVPGQVIAERISALPPNLRPRLVVLASCESAGSGRTSDAPGALAAFGPLLAQAGIPAVLAMQGQVTIDTVSQFMPVFFRELSQDGHIDRAMTAARGVVSQRPDAWMPVLYTRLRDASLWYEPGFTGDPDEQFDKWRSLGSAVNEKRCTAIIGPGIVEMLLGPRRQIAQRWAKDHGYPFSRADQDELPRIAQYVSVQQDADYVHRAYRVALRSELVRRYPALIPAEWAQKAHWDSAQIGQALKLVADARWDDTSPGPLHYLARLRLPIYVTANQGDLLAQALADAGAEPQVRICPWNDTILRQDYAFDETPTPERPLVYHLFGHMKLPDSLVISEDEYFDYLIGVKKNWDLLPNALKGALYSTSLIFLGFRIDDWAFRTFFRILVNEPSYFQLSRRSHAAVQIEPDDGRIQNVQRARNYMKEYFGRRWFSLYMGNSEEFLKELVEHAE